MTPVNRVDPTGLDYRKPPIGGNIRNDTDKPITIVGEGPDGQQVWIQIPGHSWDPPGFDADYYVDPKDGKVHDIPRFVTPRVTPRGTKNPGPVVPTTPGGWGPPKKPAPLVPNNPNPDLTIDGIVDAAKVLWTLKTPVLHF